MEQKTTFERINSIYVIHSLILGLLFLIAGMCFLKMGIKHHDMVMAVISGFGILVGTICMCIAMVYAFVLMHQIWKILQDGNVRTTPEKAVGFLFIPVFNFYWIFVAYYGLAVDFNRYIRERGITVKPLNVKLFILTCILGVASLIPAVLPFNIFVDIIVLYQMLTRYNALVEKKLK